MGSISGGGGDLAGGGKRQEPRQWDVEATNYSTNKLQTRLEAGRYGRLEARRYKRGGVHFRSSGHLARP